MNKHFSWLFVFCFAAICVELVAFGGVSYLKKRLVFYTPPQISTYQDYIESRDPVLGWPSKRMLREKYDPTGSRPIPAYPAPGGACISLYGDSFTWGDSVDDTEAWSNQLSLLRKCRVSNYGVPGYGTDQALLSFERNEDDEAPIVILNHFTGDIRRNVTQFRNLTSDDEYFQLKPRFLLKGETLELVSLIDPTLEEAKIIAEHPERVLPHEHFIPGGPSGIVRADFPYVFSLVKALGNEHLQAKFKGLAVWELYYRQDHPSGALPLTAAILRRFAAGALERSKRPIATILPNAHDIHFFLKSGRWTYQPLADAVKDDIEIFHFGPGIVQKLQGREVCEITEPGLCYGHYNAEGYRIIAEVINEYLDFGQ